MLTQGMRSILFQNNSPPNSSPPPSSSLCATLMEENISAAEPIITKWDPAGSSYSKITSLFYESRDEARRFLAAVSDLKRAMHFFISSSGTTSHLLVLAQRLMQIAMNRLQREFYQILAANRDRLDSDSLSSARSSLSTSTSCSDLEGYCTDEDTEAADTDKKQQQKQPPTAAMDDLHAIAECMNSTGYAKECFKIYKTTRRSIVDEGLYRLGFERLTSSQLNKLSWDSQEHHIKTWSAASRPAIRTLFSGERFLSDYVFAFSDTMKDSCFAEIVRDAAVEFLAFPELAAKTKNKSPEKVFQFLDLYDSISELWPEIESVFSSTAAATVRSQALSSLLKLGDAVRSMLADFEVAIQKDYSKTAPPGGGIHPLTRYVMNYLSFLADYGGALADIFADYPLPSTAALPDSFLNFTVSAPSSPVPAFSDDEDAVATNISPRLAWLILVLLCKLDGKAELYKDVALSYLFLSNNLQYIVHKVRDSHHLSHLLGHNWVVNHETKAESYARSYEKLAWRKVVETIPEDPVAVVAAEGVEAAKERMRRFNMAFEDAYKKQSGCVVADGKVRDEMKLSIARKVMVPYGRFYEVCRAALREERDGAAVVRFAPEDIGNNISDLFYGSTGSSVSGSVSVGLAGSSRGTRK